MRKYLLLAMLLPSFAHAADIQAVITKPTAKVYGSPNARSEVLVTLKKGSRIDVAGVTETGWAKVKVTVSGFKFDGWVLKSALGKAPSTAPKPMIAKPTPQPQRVAPQPTQAPLKPSSTTQLEQFFEPSSNQPSPEPAPAQESRPRVETQRERAERSVSRSSSSSEDSGDGTWKSKRLVLYGSPGFMVNQYTFSDATKDAFRYNLTGISLIAGAEYKAFDFFDDLIRLGAVFQAQYAMLNTKTNLSDGTNTQFTNLTAKNAIMDFWLKAKMMVNFQRILHKPFLLGLTVGYQYFKFMGDDIIDDNGVPVGLFIDQTTTSIPVGILAELHFLDPVTLTLGADILLKNSTSESPDASSGSSPKTKTGLAPFIFLNFPITGPHYMGLRYQYRVQKTTFTGPSSSRVNNILNEATAQSNTHFLGLEYDYHF